MKMKIILLLVMFCLFATSVQGMVPGKTYFDRENDYFKYIIKRGDTLYNISRCFRIDLSTLKKLNYNLDPNLLQIGDKVIISINKELKYHVVQSGDTVWKLSQASNLSLTDIIAYNEIKNPAALLPREVIILPPIIASNKNIKIMGFEKKNGVVYVAGVARIFEATISYALETKSGVILKEGYTIASIGAPRWGKFEFEVINIPENVHYITIFSTSAKDGSRQNEIKLEL